MIMEEFPKHFQGFKLVSLELIGNDLLGSIKYDFVDKEDSQNEIYTTVIIGSNGTGKSNLLRIIVELFRDLYVQMRDGDRTYKVRGRFNLKYAIDDRIYEYTNFQLPRESNAKINFNDLTIGDKRQAAYLLLSGKKIEFKNAVLPLAIIGNSIMVTDKFLFSDRENFRIYHYQGIRDKPQTASTASYVRRTVQRVVDSINSQAFIRGLKEVKKEFSQSDNDPYIAYRTQNTSLFFGKDFTTDKFHKYFKDIDDKYKTNGKRPPNKLPYYKSYVKDDESLVEQIVEFCQLLRAGARLNHIRKSGVKFISYELLVEQSIETLRKEFKMIEHLRNLGILSPPQIEFLKLTSDSFLEGYSIEESSSGEFHLLSSFVGFMASMQTHSLMLIDEPEISLHPNWQMKYLSFLRKLFQDTNYANSHLIVATHSHFLISDLPGSNSKIIGLQKEAGKIGIVDLPKNINTFGWSAEEVLLKVFRVNTSRNYFVAEKLGLMLDFIADENTTDKMIREKFYELKLNQLDGLTDEDPLKVVYDTIVREYVS